MDKNITAIVEDLFEKRKSTSTIGNEDGRFEIFMQLYIGFIFMYATIMFGLYFILPFVFPAKLAKATHYEKVNFAATFVSTLNDVVAVIMATYTVTHLCDYPLAIFYGEKQCMTTWRNYYAYAITWSIGYFTYDIFMMLFVFEWGGSFFV